MDKNWMFSFRVTGIYYLTLGTYRITFLRWDETTGECVDM